MASLLWGLFEPNSLLGDSFSGGVYVLVRAIYLFDRAFLDFFDPDSKKSRASLKPVMASFPLQEPVLGAIRKLPT